LTSLSSLTVLTSPDAVNKRGRVLPQLAAVNESTKLTVGCANASADCTYTPSSLDDGPRVEDVQVLDDLRFLVDPLRRVGLQHELALDDDPARRR